ncbi:MAG: sulfotransferase [Planctomycetota bacterium]
MEPKSGMTGGVSTSDSQPVFVVGHPRSGTTLLASILDRHSQIAVPPETSYLFPHRLPAISADCRSGVLTPGGEGERLMRDLGISDPSGTWNDFLTRPKRGPQELFDFLMNTYARQRGKTRWAEKSPWHLRHTKKLWRWYPAAKIIGLVRDGRDCILSTRKHLDSGHDLTWHALNWRRGARMCQRLSKQEPSRFLLIRYEDLAREPSETSRRVCDFIGVPYEQQQIKPEGGAAVRLAHETWKERVDSPIDGSRVFAWRESMKGEELASIKLILHRTLKHFDYPDSDLDGVSHASRIAGQLRLLRARFHKSWNGVLYRVRLLR